MKRRQRPIASDAEVEATLEKLNLSEEERLSLETVLQGVTEEHVLFAARLMRPEMRGEIIHEAAKAEECVTRFLSRLIPCERHRRLFSNEITDRLSFHRKIELLAKLLLDLDGSRQREKHIAVLRKLKELRNIAAHTVGVAIEDMKEGYADKHKRALLQDFPRSLREARSGLVKYLDRIRARQ